MLHGRRRVCLHIAIVLMTAASGAYADWLPVADSATDAAPTVSVETPRPGLTLVEVSVAGVELRAEMVDGVPHSVVTIPDCAPMLEAGSPELPVLARAVSLPDEGTPRLSVVSMQWRDLDASPPVPSRGSLSRNVTPGDIARVHGPVYDEGGIWPATVARLGRPFLVRDHRGVAVRVHPVRWNADRGCLEILVRATLQIETLGKGGVNAVESPVAAADRAFAPVYRSLFADGSSAEKVLPGQGLGVGYGVSERMLVVTAPSLRASVNVFADWKRECGYTVDVVDTDETGTHILGISEAIRERYVSDAGLAHLVLVGDVEQVPTNIGSYQGADSDGIYGLLSGDDLYVDVLVSRLPARDKIEAQRMIARSIAYERDPSPDAAWYKVGVGIASDEGDPADFERAELLRDNLLAADFSDVARIYQGFGGEGDDIDGAVNAGASLINYLGHGSGTGWLSVPFYNTDVHQLTNTASWPWIIDASCSNGDFSQDECFAEAWLRADCDGAPAGAVAMLSASTATSWVPPCIMQSTMVDAVIAGEVHELGAIYAAGVAEVLVQYDGLSAAIKLMEQYNLFGDGSLMVRTREPEPLAVSHASFAAFGTAAFTVALPAGSRAVLSDDATVLARAEAGIDGVVSLVPARPLNAGETVRLTVTAANAVPYRVELPVTSATTAVDPETPALAGLQGNWPNPFNPATTVAFVTLTDGPVRLSIHDVRGRLVRTLVDSRCCAGRHEASWDGRDRDGRTVASGVYLARLDTAHGRDLLKMTLSK